MSAGLNSGRTEQVVHKFGTGQPIPYGAVYLNTVAQTSIQTGAGSDGFGNPLPIIEPCWLVWHYFLVEVPVQP